MTWIPVELVYPLSGERVKARLATGKELELICDDDEWVSPNYPTIRVLFLNVTHWQPIGKTDDE
tara:strand:+ start:1251 stop:1442 length:192 start_codon:yes stop_codon:yes gene_type:complete